MDFSEQIQALAGKIQKQKAHLLTEEATKTALVLPFINMLGYDIFNPAEVIPEFTADVGIKKGEKVDYALLLDGKPIILFECKPYGFPLEQTQSSQLYRYFSVTEARIAVLTNGSTYKFFTDLESPNKMDSKPFMEFDFLAIDETLVPELKKLSKTNFDINNALSAASELKYTREIKKILALEISSPTEDLVCFFTSRVYHGRITKNVKEQFTEIVKRALHNFINDKIKERLTSIMADTEPVKTSEILPTATTEQGEDEKIITTQEEIEGFYIIKSILREICDADRIHYRDTQSYMGILLDDNNRKPICRLRFNGQNKQLGLIRAGKKEERVNLATLDDIYKYAQDIKVAISLYETND